MEGSVMRKHMKGVVLAASAILASVVMWTPVKAEECDFTLKAKLKNMASNLNTSYVPVENGNTLTFNVTLSNIYPGLVIMDPSTGNEYRYDANRSRPSEVTITGLQPDRTYRYEIYSENVACSEASLNVYYVTLPAYNSFYKDPICQGIEDYKLCNRWLKHSLSHEDFVKEVNQYKASLNQPEEEIKKEEKELKPFLQFIVDYYYIFIGLTVAGVGYVIYVRRKRDSFGF